ARVLSGYVVAGRRWGRASLLTTTSSSFDLPPVSGSGLCCAPWAISPWSDCSAACLPSPVIPARPSPSACSRCLDSPPLAASFECALRPRPAIPLSHGVGGYDSASPGPVPPPSLCLIKPFGSNLTGLSHDPAS